MDVKSQVIEIIDELFMEDVSDMMDEDLFDAGVLIVWEQSNWLWNWKIALASVFLYLNLDAMIGILLTRS